MSKKHQYDKTTDENGEKLDPFHEMLEVLDIEHLLRFRKRLEKVGRKKMVEILSVEIKERDGKEQEAAKAERAKLEAERLEIEKLEKQQKQEQKQKQSKK